MAKRKREGENKRKKKNVFQRCSWKEKWGPELYEMYSSEWMGVETLFD